MAVNLTNLDISTRYALQEDFDNGFVGRDRQIVIQTDDAKGYRPIIMDGKTSGGKNKVALLDDLENFNAATATKLKTARNLKVNLASTANAQFDGSGDATAIGVSGTLPIANGGTGRTDGHAPKDILMSGNRGTLAGYEGLKSTSAALTVNSSTQDSCAVTGAVTITVSNGAANQAWTKTIGITNASAKVSLGSSWKWIGGSAPTISANGVLVVHWCGTFGLASFAANS